MDLCQLNPELITENASLEQKRMDFNHKNHPNPFPRLLSSNVLVNL